MRSAQEAHETCRECGACVECDLPHDAACRSSEPRRKTRPLVGSKFGVRVGEASAVCRRGDHYACMVVTPYDARWVVLCPCDCHGLTFSARRAS